MHWFRVLYVIELLALLGLLNVWRLHMSAALDRLTTDVTAIRGAADSLIALVNGLAQIIRDNATDPAALNALADSLEAKVADINAAVAANTHPRPIKEDR